jgi:hypothetical protein
MYAMNHACNDYLFGMHEGHLNAQAERIAKAHGCTLVRYREPDGSRRGWFATPNVGHDNNIAKRDAVIADIDAMGGFQALRMRFTEPQVP